ncbi:MAG: hypothetical protein WAM97_13155 [Acidimicrobiales bacterium]
MLLKIRRFAIASAVVVPAVVGLSVISASAAPTHFKAVRVTAFGTGPNTTMTGKGAAVIFTPKKLTGLSAVSEADCTTSDYTFSAYNKTKASQTLTEGGESTGITIPAGDEYAICVFDDGTYKLSLSSSPTTAKLKLKVTS